MIIESLLELVQGRHAKTRWRLTPWPQKFGRFAAASRDTKDLDLKEDNHMTKRMSMISAGLIALILVLALAYRFSKPARAQDSGVGMKWEYLIVADGNSSLNSVSNPGQHKQKNFGREAVAVERNLDKLGSEGWELVAVSGTPNEPTFTLKRPKQ
jgi:hypothetical protein